MRLIEFKFFKFIYCRYLLYYALYFVISILILIAPIEAIITFYSKVFFYYIHIDLFYIILCILLLSSVKALKKTLFKKYKTIEIKTAITNKKVYLVTLFIALTQIIIKGLLVYLLAYIFGDNCKFCRKTLIFVFLLISKYLILNITLSKYIQVFKLGENI